MLVLGCEHPWKWVLGRLIVLIVVRITTLGSQQGIKIGALCLLLSLRGKVWEKHQHGLPWLAGEKKCCGDGGGVALVQAPLGVLQCCNHPWKCCTEGSLPHGGVLVGADGATTEGRYW